jgi:hypothetical protein
VEPGLAPDAVAVGVERDALGGDGGIALGESVEVPVGDGLVDMHPERLGGLQFGRAGRQGDEADAFWHDETMGGVPAGTVQYEHDDALAPCGGLTGEEREGLGEEVLVDAAGKVPEALAGCRRDEGGDVEPFEAVVAGCDRALAARCPDPAGDRPAPDAVLVGGKGLDDRAGVARGLLGDDFGEFFLNAACSSGLAARTCRGRGRWMVQPMARRASQPRCGATEASPSSPAMTAATFFAVQTPPSSGGVFTRSRSIARTSGVSRVGLAPLLRRKSPRLDGPKRL